MEGKENGQKRVPFNEVDDVRVMEDPSSHLAAGQPSLPSLPSLTSLNISSCTGMNEISGFPLLTNGLEEVLFHGSEEDPDRSFNDKTVDRIMDWIVSSSSETLEDIRLCMYVCILKFISRKFTMFK